MVGGYAGTGGGGDTGSGVYRLGEAQRLVQLMERIEPEQPVLQQTSILVAAVAPGHVVNI
jgi:hypothetical protein